MYWANFLHIYQPPTQSEQLVKKITEESYLPLIEGLEKNKRAKLTVNINGSLTELLAKNGYERLLKRIARLAEKGKIELTGSAKYHSILPLLPESEIIRQIDLNNQINRQYFGEAFAPAGFFPPEMAYSPALAKILASIGFKWLITDEIVSGGLNKISFDRVYAQLGVANLKLILRNRKISNFIARGRPKDGRKLIWGIKRRAKGEPFVITAMDGETFGHHNKNYEQVLFEAYRVRKIIPVTISELIEMYAKEEQIDAKTAGWSTSESELRRGVSFSLWHNPKNTIHRMQWRLTHLAIDEVEGHSKDPAYPTARHLLDQGLHSDQYWWASGKVIFGSFLLWSVEMIEAGARSLEQAVGMLHNVDKKTKKQAHQLYDKIIATAFTWQREGIIAKRRVSLSKKLAQKVVSSK